MVAQKGSETAFPKCPHRLGLHRIIQSVVVQLVCTKGIYMLDLGCSFTPIRNSLFKFYITGTDSYQREGDRVMCFCGAFTGGTIYDWLFVQQ